VLIKNTYINLVSNILSASIGFVVSILIVRIYGVAVVGKIAYMTGLVGIMTFVLDLGLNETSLKFISEKKERFQSEFFSFVIMKMTLFAMFMAIIVIFYRYGDFIQDRRLYLIIAGALGFKELDTIFKTTLTARRDFYSIWIAIVFSRTLMGLSAVMICLNRLSYYYVAMIPAVESVASLVISGIIVHKKYKIKIISPIHSDIIKKYISYAWPLSLQAGLSSALSNIDKVFIGNILSNIHVGYLAIAEKVFSLFDIIIKAITKQLLPEISFRYANLKSHQFYQDMQKIVLMTSFVACFLSLVILVFSDLVIYIMYGSGFHPAATILKFFVFLIFAKLVLRPYFKLALVMEKHKLFPVFVLPENALRIGILYFAIPMSLFGAPIGGIAKPVSQAASWVFPRGLYVMWQAKRSFHTLFFERSRHLIFSFVWVCLGFGLIMFMDFSRIWETVLQTMAAAVYVSILLKYDIIDKKVVKSIIRMPIDRFTARKKAKNPHGA
jgi:O-antigen/teichoic acid export membrane protein